VEVVDVRLSKLLRFDRARIELLLECFNLLNSVNYLASSYNGNMSSDAFGTPGIALPARQVQIGVRVGF
jgi:hypothetical protein